jgi:hypothetical protein
MSMTPVSSGTAADGAQVRWCWHCLQNTWQVRLSGKRFFLRQSGRNPPKEVQIAYYCERCGEATE